MGAWRLRRRPAGEPERVGVRSADGEAFVLEISPSGVVRWNYELPAEPAGWIVLPVAVLWNLVGKLAFRGGWTLRLIDASDRVVLRERFRSRTEGAAALVTTSRAVSDEGLAALLSRHGR